MKATRILFFFGIAAVASAASITFSFDTTTINGTTITGLSAGFSAHCSDAELHGSGYDSFWVYWVYCSYHRCLGGPDI